jgi:hypothetical protein
MESTKGTISPEVVSEVFLEADRNGDDCIVFEDFEMVVAGRESDRACTTARELKTRWS